MGDVSLLAATLALSLCVQAAFFAVAATFKTDTVTDLSYGLTFVLIVVWLAWAHPPLRVASTSLLLMVTAWGLRLAGYLFYRILHMKRDARFDGVREHFGKFLRFWIFQGIAAWAILIPVTLWFATPRDFDALMAAGAALWAAGLAIETIADAQKFAAKSRDPNAGWMASGLWRYSRHPNYFGELACWWGIFLYVAPGLGSQTWLGLAGPLTITVLLLFVTGIPTLDASALRKWGDDPAYRRYRRATSRVVPWWPRTDAGA